MSQCRLKDHWVYPDKLRSGKKLMEKTCAARVAVFEYRRRLRIHLQATQDAWCDGCTLVLVSWVDTVVMTTSS